MTLFWRLLLSNTLVAVLVLTVLVISPATLTLPPGPGELFWVAAVAIGSVALSAWSIHAALRPLAHLRDAMESTDTSWDGVPAGVARDDEVGRVARAYNAMLDRLALERTQSAGRALDAQEGERLRISRELHDEVGQTLTAVLLTLGQSRQHSTGETRQYVEHAQEAVRGALEEVRGISARLRPGVLDDLGLPPAVTSLTRETASAAGLRAALTLDDLGATSHAQDLAVYRICQEALTNVARHAYAENVRVALRSDDGMAELVVEDDGVGLTGPAGTGRQGMQERALLVGGQVDVADRPGGGTRVQFRFPLDPRNESTAAGVPHPETT